MKSVFGENSRESSTVVMSGVADLVTSCAVIFILLLVAYVTRVQDRDPNPTWSRAIPTAMTPNLDCPHPPLEAKRPCVRAITVSDAAINFEFGKSTLLPTAEAFL